VSATTAVKVQLLLTPKETAEVLRIDVTRLRTMRVLGLGPEFHDVGRGLIRYVRASVEAFAERAA
jgi:hypothetical protein